MAHILPFEPNLSGRAQPIRDARRMAWADREESTWIDKL